MLNSVKLTNFQRHRNLEVVLPGGLTALRGSNEAGKSTLLRGICYALFGVNALGGPLDDAVTHGEPVNTLKSEVEFTADGVTYNVKRGKSGAEVNYDGGIVTGQKEVTAFVCRLLKVDAAAAGRLMLSNQNEIRGALESGTKATTELIERLAEFDQIDALIETMQAKLTLGATAPAEAALARAQAALESAELLAVAPDVAGLERAEFDAGLQLGVARLNLKDAQSAEAEAQEAHAAARVLAVARAAVVNSLARAEGRVIELRRDVADLERFHEPVNAEARTVTLNARVVGASEQKALYSLYTQATPFFAERSGAEFLGSPEQLEDALLAGTANLSRLNNEAVRLVGEIKLLNAQLTHGSCTFCGKDFRGVPEVATKNAETQGKIAAAQADLDVCIDAAEAQQETLDYRRRVDTASRPALKFLAANAGRVERADDVLPPVLRWIGEVPSAVDVDVSIIRSEIAELAALQKAYDNAQAKLETLRPQLAAAIENEVSLENQLTSMPPVTLPQEALDSARAATRTAAAAEQTAAEHQRDAARALADTKAGYTRALESLEAAREAVSARTAEIDALVFNNALLKRVRQARPLIADRLWNLVLKAVSGYFSDIRGIKSRVTKDGDGFKVDDVVVSTLTLSGSTLDALGLAIRVALVRTFLPSAPFLILDEPAAAMDEDRTHNMLGFLASAGFQQILLVTHEDVSESVADNMIQL